MESNTFFRRVFVTGGAASAQRYPWNNGDFRLTSEGRGDVSVINRRRGAVEKINLYLRRDGRAELTVYFDRGQASLTGRWRSEGGDRDGNPRLNLDLSGRVDGSSVDGRGTVTLRRSVEGLGEKWTVDDLDLRGDDLEMRFRGDAPGSPGGPDDDYNGGSGDLTEYSGTVRGFGSLREGSDRRDVDRVEIRMERGGRLDITSYGRSTVRFEGRWRRNRDGTADLRIDRAYGRDVREGRGRVEFRRDSGRTNTPERIELNGTGYRDDFTLSFRNRDNDDDSGSGNGGGSGTVEVDSSRTGRGRLRQGDRSEVSIRRVSVNLNRTGRAQIVMESDSGARYTFSGRWTRSREGVFSIQLASALNSNSATGRGTLYLRGRDIDRLDLDGTAQSRTFRVDFSAD